MNNLLITQEDEKAYSEFISNLKVNDRVIIEYLGKGFFKQSFSTVLSVVPENKVIVLDDFSMFSQEGIHILNPNIRLIGFKPEHLQNVLKNKLAEMNEQVIDFYKGDFYLDDDAFEHITLVHSASNFPYKYMKKHALEELTSKLSIDALNIGDE